MSAHTPGPLLFEGLLVLDRRGMIVARCTDALGGGLEEGLANARLYAGASEILDWLKELIVAVHAEGTPRAALRKMAAEAALEICKAEGTTAFAEELQEPPKDGGRP